MSTRLADATSVEMPWYSVRTGTVVDPADIEAAVAVLAAAADPDSPTYGDPCDGVREWLASL